jgi:hypothetical protein
MLQRANAIERYRRDGQRGLVGRGTLQKSSIRHCLRPSIGYPTDRIRRFDNRLRLVRQWLKPVL